MFGATQKRFGKALESSKKTSAGVPLWLVVGAGKGKRYDIDTLHMHMAIGDTILSGPISE